MTLAAAQRAPAFPHDLDGSLAGVAHELRLLRAQMLRIQGVCAPGLDVALDAEVIRELQGLDLVSQRLDALAGFVEAIIAAAPFDPALDLTAALAAIPLKDLADRLSAQAMGLGPLEDGDDPSGDFDLF